MWWAIPPWPAASLSPAAAPRGSLKHLSFVSFSSSLSVRHLFVLLNSSYLTVLLAVVARCESFIAGWGLDHMLQRAEAYSKAGADAILCHSKRSNPSEIQAFMKAWKERGNKTPVVIVPTKYYTTPTKDFQDWGVSLVIWANHNLRCIPEISYCLLVDTASHSLISHPNEHRASVQAMQQTCKQIHQDQSLVNVESKIVPVNEVFRLQNNAELKEAETAYLPKKGK